MDDLEKQYRTSSILRQALCTISNLSVNSNWTCSLETLNLGQNWQFFVACGLEMWRMTFKNNSAPLLCCFNLCASFHSKHWIQTGVTVRKRPIWVKIGNFLVPCDLEIWWITLKNNRTPLLYNIKLCASFQSHRWIQTGVAVRKRPIRVKISNFLSPVTL